MTAGAGDIRAGRAFVEIFAKDSEAMKAINRMETRLKSLGDSAKRVGLGMAATGAAISAPMMVAARQFAAFGDTLNKMSARVGVSAQALSELKFAAEQSGTNIDGLEKAVRKMQQNIGKSTQTAEFVKSLDAVGMKLSELRSMNPEAQFTAITSAIGKIGDPTRRAAAAMEFFGKSGTSLLPMLGNIDALREEAQALGITMSDKTAQQAADLTDAMNRVRRSMESAMYAVGSAVSGPIIALSHDMALAAKSAGEWAKENPELFRSMLLVGTAVSAAGVAIVGIGYASQGAAASLAILKGGFVALNISTKFLVGLPAAMGALVNSTMLATAATPGLIGSFSTLGKTVGILAGQLALAGGAFAIGWQVGKWISEITGLNKALESLFKLVYSTQEMTTLEAIDDAIDRLNKKFILGEILAKDYARAMADLNRRKMGIESGAAPSVASPVIDEEDEEKKIAAAKKVSDFEAQMEEQYHRQRIANIENESQRAIAEIMDRGQKDLADAEEVGASRVAIEERIRLELDAVTQKTAKARIDAEKQYADEMASMNNRLLELRAQSISDETAREIELIKIRYAREVAEAAGATEKIAKLREMERLELGQVDAAKQERISGSDEESRRRIAELELESAYTGYELEKRKLELARERALEEARRIGASEDLVNREYDLRKKILDAQDQTKTNVAGTFSSRLSGMFGNADSAVKNEQKDIKNATQETAKNTGRIAESLAGLVKIGA